MGSGLPVCLTCQYWLWLLSLILIRDFISLQSLEEPEAAFSLDLSQEAYSLKKKKKIPHDFRDHKREVHSASGNFSRSIWVILIKTNEGKMHVCVCVCVCELSFLL